MTGLYPRGPVTPSRPPRFALGKLSPFARVCALLLLLFAAAPAAARSLALIVAGAGGEPEYERRFQDWAARLRDVLVEQRAHDRVVLLTESGENADGRSGLAAVRAELGAVASRGTSGTDLFVYLIGHGSYREAAKLNLPGPDLSADELGRLLDAVRFRRTVVVNTASASAGFINALSGPDRIVCASTKSIDERNATRFAGYLIEALEGGSADRNRDGRVSVLEVCRQAALLTEASYTAEGYVATEHAILDDNGDRRGTRLLVDPDERAVPRDEATSPDGTLASRTFIRDWSFPPEVPASWIADYRRAMENVEDHIARKSDLESSVYYARLESLLVQAARLHQRIRNPGR